MSTKHHLTTAQLEAAYMAAPLGSPKYYRLKKELKARREMAQTLAVLFDLERP